MAARPKSKVVSINGAVLEVKHDGPIQIAAGRSRKETKWKNTELTWSELLQKLQSTTRTRETFTQYKKMSKTDQSEIKDVGGFVGGTLRGGRRKAGQVLQRSLLTLDADYADADFLDTVGMLLGNAYAIYSTHSHAPEAPRYRLIIPLVRNVTADEYQAIARYIASDIGIDLFDDTTYQPERLMYWPSTAEDGEYVFDHADGPWLDPDDVLDAHPFWQDASTWPVSSRAGFEYKRKADKQGHPHEKPGVIGAFCRAHTISEAIDVYLPDIYVECDIPNRYTYTLGSTAAGLVVYDDDLFAFSNHSTDPIGGQLCNAFDLVRIHKFGHLDDDKHADTAVTGLPSYQEMLRLALADPETKIELATSSHEEALADFAEALDGEEVVIDNKWKRELDFTEKGTLVKNINNALLLIENDTALRGAIGYDDFTRRPVTTRPLPWKATPGPWSDSDDAALRHHLEHVHSYRAREDVQDALTIVLQRHTFHPVRDYLDGLTWDGKPRVDRLLVDFMGAEDTEYVRQVTRKWLCAAAARVRSPGCKMDTMLILVGPQGLGKSQFFARLARQPEWFSDSMSEFDNKKESMEQLAGKWILEIGELAGMKRADVEGIKTFLSKQADDYRPSYGRRLLSFPRQCVFGGTSNRDDFLQDATGARRFWPVTVKNASRMWAEMTKDYVDQVWAEADAMYAMGEVLYLEGAAVRMASEIQDNFTELGGKIGMAELYLERLVPKGWASMPMKDRVDWLHGYDFDSSAGGELRRERISGLELFVECFNGLPEAYKKSDAHEMTDILTKLGWKKTGERAYVANYGRQRLFSRAE